jgi:hypothetical protein
MGSSIGMLSRLRRPRLGDTVCVKAEHPMDLWEEARGKLIADFGEAGKLVSYQQQGETIILGVVPRESWGKSDIDGQARPDVLVCGTVASV